MRCIRQVLAQRRRSALESIERLGDIGGVPSGSQIRKNTHLCRFEQRIIRRTDWRGGLTICKSIDAHHSDGATLDAKLMLVRASGDLLLKKPRGDSVLGAAESVGLLEWEIAATIRSASRHGAGGRPARALTQQFEPDAVRPSDQHRRGGEGPCLA